MSQQVLFLWMTHIQMPIPMLEVSYVLANPGPGYLKTLFSWVSPAGTSKNSLTNTKTPKMGLKFFFSKVPMTYKVLGTKQVALGA